MRSRGRLLTRDEVATLLGIKANTLSVWLSKGRYNLPVVKVGRLSRYRRADVEVWLRCRTVRSETTKARGND